MKLVFSNGSGLIECPAGTWPIDVLPALSFECDGLFFDDFGNHCVKHVGGGNTEMTADEVAEVMTLLLSVTPPPASAPTMQQIEAQATAIVQTVLDDAAKARGYDGIVSACSYAAAPNLFQAESIAFLSWRAACWSHCYALMADVVSGSVPMPSADEFVAGLPALHEPME